MVHIRAVPEGGLSGAGGATPIATNLPFTFYDRYTPGGSRTADRRQPLPSMWAARFIQGGIQGLATDLKIWREGVISGLPDCTTSGAETNSAVFITDLLRFDEHENSMGFGSNACTTGCAFVPSLPATSRTNNAPIPYPAMIGSDLGGWLYLNLSSGARDARSSQCHPVLSAQRSGFGTCSNEPLGTGGSRTTSQNWVVESMFGLVLTSRLSVDFDAVTLGNGCTPAADRGIAIAPATQRNGLVCPENTLASNCAPGTFPPPRNP